MNEQIRGNPASESVKSASRALAILELLTAASKPLSFSACQQQLGYPKASLHGLLHTMAAARWLSFDQAAKGYVLGVRVWEAGMAYSTMLPLEERARPMMVRLRDLTTETIQLAVLDDFDVLYIAKVDGEHMLRLDSAVGRRLEPHATGVGRVLLAGLAKERLDPWLTGRRFTRYTPNTITEPKKLLAELRSITACGYATDREERTLGASCMRSRSATISARGGGHERLGPCGAVQRGAADRGSGAPASGGGRPVRRTGPCGGFAGRAAVTSWCRRRTIDNDKTGRTG